MTRVAKYAFARALAVTVCVAVGAWVSSMPAAAQSAEVQAEARQALESFFRAVMSGESGKVAAVLAPEFQILRADGSKYDAKSYPESNLPVIDNLPAIEELVVTSADGIMVTSYVADVSETRDGKVVQAVAPRLTVFRRLGDDWLVAAHGNFAVLGK